MQPIDVLNAAIDQLIAAVTALETAKGVSTGGTTDAAMAAATARLQGLTSGVISVTPGANTVVPVVPVVPFAPAVPTFRPASGTPLI